MTRSGAQPLASQLGDNVRAALAERGVSQTVLGEHLGLDQSNISCRIRGVTPFKADELAAIASFLSIPVADLYSDNAA